MVINLSDYVIAINEALDDAIAKAKDMMDNDNSEANVKKYTDLVGATTWFNLLISAQSQPQVQNQADPHMH